MRGRWAGWCFCSLGMASAGSVVVASKLAGAGLPLFTAAALRYGLAALILVPWALVRHNGIRPCRRDWLVLIAQAVAGSLGFSILLLWGLRSSSGVDAGVITGTLPAMVGLLSMLVPGKGGGGRVWPAIILASLGAASLGLAPGLPEMEPSGGRWFGDLLILGAVAGEAIFVLLNKALRAPLPPVAMSAILCVLGLLMSLPMALTEISALDPAGVPSSAWLAVLWHAAIPTIGGFVLWYAGAARLGGAEAAVTTALMPVSAVLLSALLLGETIGGHHLLGIGLVVAAITIQVAAPQRRP
ncbi:MAG: DMT family transporter [Magnetospirillum sp.]|nr:DMT family transporter [Magnetospirillum sp.]